MATDVLCYIPSGERGIRAADQALASGNTEWLEAMLMSMMHFIPLMLVARRRSDGQECLLCGADMFRKHMPAAVTVLRHGSQMVFSALCPACVRKHGGDIEAEQAERMLGAVGRQLQKEFPEAKFVQLWQ